MKIFKKTLKILGIIILLIFIGSGIYIYVSGPTLPKETDNKITTVLSKSLPELIKGESGFSKSQGLKIWYEIQKPKDSIRGTVLLIAGHSESGLSWSQKFITEFIKSGYQVIRYDNRGTGLSDSVEDWDRNNPYSLRDMANDGISILNTLNISKAHLIGVSLGGMIAQVITINQPDRVSSLTSIMSSANVFDSEVPSISSEVSIEMILMGLKYGIIGGEKNMVKMQLANKLILKGNASNDINIQGLAEQVLYGLRKHGGYNLRVGEQHQKAITTSTSRYGELKNSNCPVIYIHGKLDPLIPIEHGKKCVENTPNSKSLWIEDMGHDIPDEMVDHITLKIIQNFNRNNNIENKTSKHPQPIDID